MAHIRHFHADHSTTRIPRRSIVHAIPTSRYPELSGLPKAPALRSIRFKRTTPGVASRLLLAPTTTPLVDGSHPLAPLPPQQLFRIVPQYYCPLFSVHAYPHALLNRFDDPELYNQARSKGISNELNGALDQQSEDRSRTQLVQETGRAHGSIRTVLKSQSTGDRRRAAHTIPISLVLVTPKKTVHKSAVVRNRVKLRIKEALNLVTIRGAKPVAEANSSPGEATIVLSTPEGIPKDSSSESTILEKWTYIMRPSLEIYRCPWPSLLTHVREALAQIKARAGELEAKWASENRYKRNRTTRNGADEGKIPQNQRLMRGRDHLSQAASPGARKPRALRFHPETHGHPLDPRSASKIPSVREPPRSEQNLKSRPVPAGMSNRSNNSPRPETQENSRHRQAHLRPNAHRESPKAPPEVVAQEESRRPRVGRLFKSPIVMNPQEPSKPGYPRRGG